MRSFITGLGCFAPFALLAFLALLACFALSMYIAAALHGLSSPGPTRPLPFESEAWKDGDIWDRKCMADDVVERVLIPGMPIDECRRLLGDDAYLHRSLVYEIWGMREGDPCSPVELVFSKEVKVSGSGRRSRYARLHGLPWNECELGYSPWTLTNRHLEAAQLALRSGGLERWCADETGARLELAESMRDVVEHGWPSDLSFEVLESCADHEREFWSFTLYTEHSACNLDIYFEDGVLDQARIYENY